MSQEAKTKPETAQNKNPARVDFISLAGLALALTGILGGLLMEGGRIRDVAQITAAMIVLGGTLGAVMVSTPLYVLKGALRRVAGVFLDSTPDLNKAIEEVIGYATKARKNGLVSLEQEADQIEDPFLKKALNLGVDGTDIQEIRKMLELQIEFEDLAVEAEAKVFESAGGYAPTIGIIGAVLGLIQVMKNLANIDEVGHGIAVAFVATVYGVGSANLLFLPMAAKIKARQREVSKRQELILEGVAGIVEGLNPKLIREKLRAFTGNADAPAEPAKGARAPEERAQPPRSRSRPRRSNVSRRRKPPEHENHERWLISYADFITLLFAFFVVMFATSQTDKGKAEQVSESVKKALDGEKMSTVLAAILGGTVSDKGKGNAMMRGPGGAQKPALEKPDDTKKLAELVPSLKVLSEELKKEIESGQIQISMQPRGLVVSFTQAALFPSGEDVISPAAYEGLEKVAAAINKLPNPVRLEGHTDSVPIRGRFRSNWELSAARSIALMELLTQRFGVQQDRLSIAGYGDTAPIASNATEAGRARNRRVDIVVLNEQGMIGEPLKIPERSQ